MHVQNAGGMMPHSTDGATEVPHTMHSPSSHVLLVMAALAVHELGYTAMPRAFVLPGSRALEPEAAAHLLGPQRRPKVGTQKSGLGMHYILYCHVAFRRQGPCYGFCARQKSQRGHDGVALEFLASGLCLTTLSRRATRHIRDTVSKICRRPADGAAGSRGGRQVAPLAASCCRCRKPTSHWTAYWRIWRCQTPHLDHLVACCRRH